LPAPAGPSMAMTRGVDMVELSVISCQFSVLSKTHAIPGPFAVILSAAKDLALECSG